MLGTMRATAMLARVTAVVTANVCVQPLLRIAMSAVSTVCQSNGEHRNCAVSIAGRLRWSKCNDQTPSTIQFYKTGRTFSLSTYHTRIAYLIYSAEISAYGHDQHVLTLTPFPDHHIHYVINAQWFNANSNSNSSSFTRPLRYYSS